MHADGSDPPASADSRAKLIRTADVNTTPLIEDHSIPPASSGAVPDYQTKFNKMMFLRWPRPVLVKVFPAPRSRHVLVQVMAASTSHLSSFTVSPRVGGSWLALQSFCACYVEAVPLLSFRAALRLPGPPEKHTHHIATQIKCLSTVLFLRAQLKPSISWACITSSRADNIIRSQPAGSYPVLGGPAPHRRPDQ